MKKVIRLTESDLVRLIKRVIKENTTSDPNFEKIKNCPGVKEFVAEFGMPGSDETENTNPSSCKKILNQILEGKQPGIFDGLACVTELKNFEGNIKKFATEGIPCIVKEILGKDLSKSPF